MATLDVTEKVNVLVDAIGWEGFCEELMARMDEDALDWLIVGIAGAWSYDMYGLHVAHDGKKEKKPLRAEWLVHELTDAGEEV